MKATKENLEKAETGAAVLGAVVLSAAIWWPIGPAALGYWYYRRRWQPKNKKK